MVEDDASRHLESLSSGDRRKPYLFRDSGLPVVDYSFTAEEAALADATMPIFSGAMQLARPEGSPRK